VQAGGYVIVNRLEECSAGRDCGEDLHSVAVKMFWPVGSIAVASL